MFLLLGIILTIFVGLFPLVADTFIKKSITNYTTLDKQKELVSVSSQAQQTGHIYLGIHGYDHICPLDGSTAYELYCPSKGSLPYSEAERRIIAGLEIFNRSGLHPDWYAFPGGTYDSQCLSILVAENFSIIPYPITAKPALLPVSVSLQNYSFPSPLDEYTWMWRKGISNSEYQQAVRSIKTNGYVEILLHISDFTNQTKTFLNYALANCNTTIIRCDDIATDFDAPKTKELIAFAKEKHVELFLAVIPASKEIPTLGAPFSSLISATWGMTLATFFLPIFVTVPWAMFFKHKRKIKSDDNFQPKVSLILPAYNEQKIIGSSIEHALAQDYKGQIEIIVIDDGSTDNTRDIVSKVAAKYPNVKLICQLKNGGKPEALNRGFREATGEISIFQDTDSIIVPNLVSLMVPHFEDPKVGMVAGMIVVENENNLLTKMQQIEYLYSQSIVRFCQAAHQNVLVCPGAATAVRTQIAKEIPSTDRTVTEDADFTFSVWRLGWKISQEPDAISYTEAPEKLAPFWDQRKRWLYGVLQTIILHKWALRKNNLWVIWAWLGYFMCPLTIISFITPVLLSFILGPSFLLFSFVYAVLTLSLFMAAQAVGVTAYSRKKAKLTILLPLYLIYQTLLQLLLVYLVFAYVTGIGIHVKYGGKKIHAVH